MAAGQQTAPAKSAGVLEVRRLLSATPEEVFAAWTDPKSMSKWMRPGVSTKDSRVDLDVRVGGKYRIDMIGETEVHEHTGEYLVVDPPRKLAFTWISKHIGGERSVVTVTLHPRGDKTELVLTHEGLAESAREPHRGGWTEILEQLASALEK
jgi:uncharacterized protein YndB with AHSA1/START domain